jgi:hypothetical protein
MVTYARDLSGIDMLILFGFHHLQFFGLIVHHPQCLIAAHLGVVVPMAIPILIFSTENAHCNSQVIRSCHGQTLNLYNEGVGRLNHFILFSFEISSNSFLGAQEAFNMLVTFYNKFCYFSHRKLGKIGKIVFF